MDEIEESRFGGALLLATALKIAASVVALVALVSATVGGMDLRSQTNAVGAHDVSGAAIAGYVAAVLTAGVVLGGTLGFLGYALEVLVDSNAQLWRLRFGEDEDSDQ